MITLGLATRLWYHAGLVGAPAIEAKITTRSPSGRYTSGVVRCAPDLAPTVVSSTIGAPSNGPPTLPPCARNSSMTLALKSLTPPTLRPMGIPHPHGHDHRSRRRSSTTTAGPARARSSASSESTTGAAPTYAD